MTVRRTPEFPLDTRPEYPLAVECQQNPECAREILGPVELGLALKAVIVWLALIQMQLHSAGCGPAHRDRGQA